MKLKISHVGDAGKDDERIYLEAKEDLELDGYLLTDTTYSGGSVSNKNPHTYRFPAMKVKKGEWVCLWTKKKPGKNHTQAKVVVHELSWNLAITVWNKQGDKAELYELADTKEVEIKAA